MRKINSVLLVIFSVFLIFICSANYSFKLDNDLDEISEKFDIKKPVDLEEGLFITKLIENSTKSNVNIVFKIATYENDVFTTNFYTTNHNSIISDYLNVNDNEISDENYITNYRDVDNQKINSFNIFSNQKIQSFEQLDKFKLDNNKFYIIGNNNDVKLFRDNLKNQKIDISESQGVSSTNYEYFFDIQIYLLVLVLLSFIIVVFAREKEDNIKKSLGYSRTNIFIDVIKKFSLFLVFLTFLSILLCILVSFAFNTHAMGDFILYFLNLFKYYIFLYLIFLLLSNIYICKNNLLNIIKGYNISSGIIIISVVVKISLIFLILGSLNSTIDSYKKFNDTYSSAKTIIEKTSSYASIQANLLSFTYTKELEQLLDKHAINIYKNTVDELDGILIDINNHRSIVNEKTTCEEFNQCEIYVNNNYLKKNDVMLIDNKNLDSNKTYLLLPEGSDPKKTSLPTFVLEEDILYYKKDTSFYSYNEFAVKNNGNIIDPPVIVLPSNIKDNEDEILTSIIGTIIGNGHYLVKVDTDDPLGSVSKYLSEEESTYFRDVKLLSSRFNEEIEEIKIKMTTNLLFIIFNLLLLLIIMVTMINIFIEKNKKIYTIKFLQGFSIEQIINKLFVLNIIIYIIMIVSTKYLLLSLILFIVDTLILRILCVRIVRKKINNILKEN